MSNIYLVGLDGSEASSHALDYAAETAKHTGARLILAHVIDWSGYEVMGPEEVASRHQVREAEIESAKKNILAPAEKRATELGVTAETVLHHGNATSTLLDMIQKKNATHVFVGRHGQSRLEALIFGSTTNALAQSSPVPVTVVP